MRRSLLAGSLALLIGCFQSTTPLGTPTEVLRDSALIGDWRCTAQTMDAAEFITVAVRAFDNKQLLVEVSEVGADTDRYRFYPSKIGSTVLWNGQELRDDNAPGLWVFLALQQPMHDTLLARVVQDDALKGSTDAAKLADLRNRADGPDIFGEAISCARLRSQ